MKIISPSFEIYWIESGSSMLQRIEAAGRTAYKSEDKITDDSAEKFVKMITQRGHHSVIEHVSVSARVICDRGITHEIVRHRIASYTQESTRYCNYSNAKFGNELTFIMPVFLMDKDESDPIYAEWKNAMKYAEERYLAMLEKGAQPQEARSVLPNSLKTEIVMTMNLREWRHFFNLRTSGGAHPDMRYIAKQMLEEFKGKLPAIFSDL